MNRKRKILLALLVVFLLMQFVRTTGNSGEANGANDISHVVKVPASVQQILAVSCYDCHSDHTDYPWYARIQPLGFWLEHHVNEGKRELNFSQFATYSLKRQKHKLKELKEQLEEGEMPLSSYTLIHKNAKLAADQIALLNAWVDSCQIQLGPLPAEHE